VSSIPGHKSRYVAPPAQPAPAVARTVSRSSDWVWLAVPPIAGCLAVVVLAATLQSPAPAATNLDAYEPAEEAVNFTAPAGNIADAVSVAHKGSRLAMAVPVAAAPAPEPKRVRVAMITPDLPMGAIEPEPKSPAIKGTATYGLASYYSKGQMTANGERFNAQELTAAHRTLPFGTRVRVTSLETGRSVTVRINDRGPFIRGRTLDISRAAAQSLGMIDRGVAKVQLDVLK
jgi:rare lipoprotein A